MALYFNLFFLEKHLHVSQLMLVKIQKILQILQKFEKLLVFISLNIYFFIFWNKKIEVTCKNNLCKFQKKFCLRSNNKYKVMRLKERER